MSPDELVSAAESKARELLAPLGQRWDHVRGVASRAEAVASRLGVDSGVLVTAAYLHDIGYAPDLVETGFHPLDGARAVRRLGLPEIVVSLVAYHSMSPLEAELRELTGQLATSFQPPDPALADALCYCDMTTGPAGQHMAVKERLAEIQCRYGSGHVVTSFVDRARVDIIRTVERVEVQLSQRHDQPM